MDISRHQEQISDLAPDANTHTQGGQLDGSIRLLGIRSTGLLIQIALLNGCERLLRYLPVLVSLVGIRVKSFPSLFLTHINCAAPAGAWLFGVKQTKLALFTNIMPNLMNKLSLEANVRTLCKWLKHIKCRQSIYASTSALNLAAVLAVSDWSWVMGEGGGSQYPWHSLWSVSP